MDIDKNGSDKVKIKAVGCEQLLATIMQVHWMYCYWFLSPYS